MKKNFTLVFCALIVIMGTFSNNVFAQAKNTLYVDTIDNNCTVGSSVSLSLRTKNFNAILGFQGSLKWDTSVIKYTGISYGSSSIVLNASNVTLTKTSGGIFSFLWSDPNLTAQAVPDTTVLLTLKFNIQKKLVGYSPVYFSNSPTKLEIDTADGSGLPAVSPDTAFKNGAVGFVSQPTISKVNVLLTANASGTPSGYQWTLNQVAISGATSKTYSNATVAGGSYTVIVSYANGCRDSATPTLPIYLKSFTGYYKEGVTVLNWSVVNEFSSTNYIVERSANGKNFTSLNTIAASNSLTGAYKYNDASSITSGKLYYRLKISDKNGGISYSNVVLINLSSNTSFSVYPNPVQAKLNLQVQNSKIEKVTIQVIDLLGKVLQQQSSQLNAGINSLSLDVASLAKGSYIVVVKGETNHQQQFIKN